MDRDATKLAKVFEPERYGELRQVMSQDEAALEAFAGGAPHAYEPHPGYPAWCARCPLPREHKVHAGAAAGEQP